MQKVVRMKPKSRKPNRNASVRFLRQCPENPRISYSILGAGAAGGRGGKVILYYCLDSACITIFTENLTLPQKR